MPPLAQIRAHVESLLACTACPRMVGPVVSGRPVLSPVMLIGQAPGTHEGAAGKPFAWTAGKTLFRWFAEAGLDEASFRERVYMAAVCRCFPGKAPKGGDRVPASDEIARCSVHLAREVALLRPTLVLPVGKLAIAQVLPEATALAEVVGRAHRATLHGHEVEVIPLPHPSGASTWHRTEPGKTLLADALALLARHPAWRSLGAGRAA
ncbi:MAG: uracil-DNA glycosylase family protein [Kofleriaceae bacterium]